MRITILTAGSRGDVEPYVALGNGLREAGNDVRIATHEGYRGLVEAYGLRFATVADTPPAVASTGRWRRLQQSGDNFISYLYHLWRVTGDAGALFDAMLDDFWAASLDADLVVGSSSGFAAPQIAGALGVKHCWALVQPMTPTREFPQFLAPRSIDLGGRGNLLTYGVAERIYWRLFGPAVARWTRRTLGTSLPRRHRPTTFFAAEPGPVLYGISPQLVPRPADWCRSVRLCGLWTLEAPPTWHCPPELSDFLDHPSRPVFVSLAAIRHEPRRRLLSMVVEALRRTGQRGILGMGGEPVDGLDLPATVLAVQDVPYHWLFPRVAAVVYHGGSGTTANVLRAGVPAVGVPNYWDQPFWSRRIHHLGLGPAPIPARRLTVGRLVEAIRSMTTDRRTRERADEVGRLVRAEDGVRAGVDYLGGGFGVPADPAGRFVH